MDWIVVLVYMSHIVDGGDGSIDSGLARFLTEAFMDMPADKCFRMHSINGIPRRY